MSIHKFSFVVLVFFCSCRNDQYIPDVCFDQKVLPILTSKCATSGCHNSIDKKADYDFTNYEGVMKAVTANRPMRSVLWLQIYFGKMPPRGYEQLNDEQKNIIKSWIQFGAKNSTCNVPNVCDTTKTYVYADIKVILSNHCTGCHNTNNSGGGWDLSNYVGVKTAASSGALLGAIEWLPGYSPMPKSAPKLSSCNISIIKKWISDGMPQ